MQYFAKNGISDWCCNDRADVKNDMHEPCEQESEIDLIDDAESTEIMTDAMTERSFPIEREEWEEISRYGK